jgi:sugar O-acyltransferase (sialic acid O-acetyltransferase NeuD family)
MTEPGAATRAADARSWLVFGAGGHARSVVDVIERRGERVAAVVGETRGGPWRHPLVSDESAALDRAVDEGLCVVPGIGAAAPRVRIMADLAARGWTGEALVAATATVAPDVPLGPGTAVLEHAHVGPASRIGVGVIVNTGAVVEHDCSVGDGTHLGPGSYLLGAATVGERSFVGSGARVLPGVTVGSDVVVGAGAVVVADVPDGVTVVGVPARVVRRTTS